MIRRAVRYVRQFDRNLWVLCLGWFVGALGFAAAIPFLSIYFHERMGMSMTEIGAFFGAMALIRAVFQAVGGELSDRMKRKNLLVFAQLFRAVAFLALGLAIGYDLGFWPIAFFMTVNSIFGAIYVPALHALVSDILPEAKRLDGYALTRSAGNLGWAVGPAIGGFMAHSSYAGLFYIAAAILLTSGVIFWSFFRPPANVLREEAFHFKDLLALKEDKKFATYCVLTFLLFLVVAQLIAPFSVYTVGMAGLSEIQLGYLYTINGLLVALTQVPVTRMLRGVRFTTQLAIGSLLYFVGYGATGLSGEYAFLVVVIITVTTGEVIGSPPSLTLTSRMAPKMMMGRYMGIYSFFEAAGWSLGPLYGGWYLDHLADEPAVAWLLIASLALIAALGFAWFGKRIDDRLNR